MTCTSPFFHNHPHESHQFLYFSNSCTHAKITHSADFGIRSSATSHLPRTAKVVSRLKKDWKADMEAYDRGHVHMLMFADALTGGIVKQFPKKFQ